MHSETAPAPLRPFGMRYLSAGNGKPASDGGDAHAYDPVLQLTVTPTGDPWALYANVQRMESSTYISDDGTSQDVTDPY